MDDHQATAGICVPPTGGSPLSPDFFGIDTAQAQALEHAGMHIIKHLYSEAHGHCIQNKRVRRAGLESRITIACSVFLKAIVSDEAVTVEYRTGEGGLNHGINQQYEIRRNTVGRSPPRNAWPARTVHVRRYARTRTASRPLLSSWMRAMSGATADQSGVRPAMRQGATDDHRLAKPTRLGARPGPVVGIRRRRKTGVIAPLSRTRSAAAF